jgi:hypothetical protein
MKGFHLSEQGHVVNIIPPVDINGAAKNSDVFSMKNYAHVDIVIQLGVTGAASTVTVEECDNVTPSNSTAIAFAVYKEETAAGDTLGARTAVTTAGFATSTNDNVMYVISIDADELTDAYPYLRIAMSDPSASTIVSAVAVLSGARYGKPQSATAIT